MNSSGVKIVVRVLTVFFLAYTSYAFIFNLIIVLWLPQTTFHPQIWMELSIPTATSPPTVKSLFDTCAM